MRVYLHNTHLNYASQVTQCLVGLKTSQKDSKYTHVHWESSDRSVQILDQEVSNLEAARTTEEGSTKGGVTPEMVCSSTLPQAPAVGSSQREDAGLDGTFLHRKQFLSSLRTCHEHPLPPSALFPHGIPVPVLLKRDCKHQETLLLMRSSMTVTENPCRNVCCAQGSRAKISISPSLSPFLHL